MLYVCALHVAQVRGWPFELGGAAVEYMGWKSYGAPLHVKLVGSHTIWRNPFDAAATMRPDWPVVVSRAWTSKPCPVSCIDTTTLSPGFISSVWALGVNDATVCWSG